MSMVNNVKFTVVTTFGNTTDAVSVIPQVCHSTIQRFLFTWSLTHSPIRKGFANGDQIKNDAHTHHNIWRSYVIAKKRKWQQTNQVLRILA